MLLLHTGRMRCPQFTILLRFGYISNRNPLCTRKKTYRIFWMCSTGPWLIGKWPRAENIQAYLSHLRLRSNQCTCDVFFLLIFRRDSDVYHPYYKIFPLEGEHSTPHDILSGVEKSKEHKTKLVLWIVSNCHTQSKREEYVSELERFVPVDIYGSCGDFPCSRDGGGCLPAISHQYKFYLSFENSLCNDYITEKLFIVMQYDIVPVVFGGGDYESVAPPGSYIDANDFESPRALADYLIFLNKNPDKYLEYFQWKSKYKVNIGDGWCSLCRQLTEQKANPVKKQYPNLWGWWNYMDLGSNVTTQTQNFDSQHKPVCQAPVEASTDSFRLTDFAVRFRQLRRWLRLEVLG